MTLPSELLSSHPLKMDDDTKQPWGDGESDWLDFDSLSPLALELKASVVQAGKWTIIQHMEFDVDVDSEPYHASQVLVNRVTREFIVRVWGRTFRKGTVSGITELHGVCVSALGVKAVSCPGHYMPERTLDMLGDLSNFGLTTHPFNRWVSNDCKVLYEEAKHGNSQVRLCSSCTCPPVPFDKKLEHMGQNVKKEQNMFPVKDEYSGPMDFLEVGYGEGEPPDKPLVTHDEQRKKNVNAKAKCEQCGEEFQFSFQMRSHLIRTHQWGIFVCHLCGYTLFHPDELSRHLWEKHKEGEGVQDISATCPSCEEEVFLENINTLGIHYSECTLTAAKSNPTMPKRRKRPVKEKANIVCDICGRQSQSQAALKIHMMKHTREYPYTCPLPDCGKGYATKTALKLHVEAHERQEKGLLKPKLFQCEHCGKPMESKYRLKEHVALTHEKKSLDVKCTECALVFVHKRQMVHHRNLVHFPDRYKCNVCEKVFRDSGQLKRHVATHDPEGKFECDLCGKKLKSKQSLDDHLNVHQGKKPYGCPWCDYRGTSSYLLRHHKQSRHRTEFELERRERDKEKVTVPVEVQQKAAEEAWKAYSEAAEGAAAASVKTEHSWS